MKCERGSVIFHITATTGPAALPQVNEWGVFEELLEYFIRYF